MRRILCKEYEPIFNHCYNTVGKLVNGVYSQKIKNRQDREDIIQDVGLYLLTYEWELDAPEGALEKATDETIEQLLSTKDKGSIVNMLRKIIEGETARKYRQKESDIPREKLCTIEKCLEVSAERPTKEIKNIETLDVLEKAFGKDSFINSDKTELIKEMYIRLASGDTLFQINIQMEQKIRASMGGVYNTRACYGWLDATRNLLLLEMGIKTPKLTVRDCLERHIENAKKLDQLDKNKYTKEEIASFNFVLKSLFKKYPNLDKAIHTRKPYARWVLLRKFSRANPKVLEVPVC